MKIRFIPFLLASLPLVLNAIEPTLPNFNYNQLFEIPIQAKALLEPNRNWRLQEVTQRIDHINDGTYGIGMKWELFYNESLSMRIDSLRTFSYLAADSTWTYSSSTYNIYDQSGEYITERLNQPWDYAQPMYKSVYTYDNQNRLVSDSYYVRVPSTLEYNHSWTYEYIYGTDRLLRYNYLYEGSPPINYLFAHDAQGRIITLLREGQEIVNDSLQWVTVVIDSLAYHQSDTSTGLDLVDYLSHTPYNFSYQLFYCFGKLEERKGWYGNHYTTFSEIYTYDMYDRLADILQQLSTDHINYTNDTKYLYLYNTEGNLASYIKQQWMPNTQSWYDHNIVDFAWEQTSSVEPNEVIPVPFNINAYPNPFNSEVNIRFDSKDNALVETSVYNIRGQLIKAFGNSRNTSITWDGKDNQGKSVSNGIYFIKATQDGKSISKKVIKIK